MYKFVSLLIVFLALTPKFFSQLTSQTVYSVQAFDTIAEKTGVLRVVGKKMGFQNVLGKWLIHPEYDWIETSITSSDAAPVIRHGFVKVSKDKQYGIVDLNGTTIIPCAYNDIYPDVNGFLALSALEEKTYFDFSGNKRIVKSQSGFTGSEAYFTYDVENLYGDSLFHLVNVPYRVSVEHSSEGFSMVLFYPFDTNSSDGGISKGVYGFLNSNGKWAIEPSLPMSQDFYSQDRTKFHFHSGRALVKNGKDVYYIDTTGHRVFSVDTLLRDSESYPFTDFGYAPVVHLLNNRMQIVYYNTDGSVRLRTTEKLVLGLNTAWSPLTDYLHFLPLLDKQTNQYILLDEQLKNELSRFSTFDSLSTWPRNADGLVMTKNFLFLRRQTTDTCNKVAVKIISPNGKLVHDWFGLEHAYDPYTGIYILREEHSIKLMEGSSGKVIFQCDSCNCSYSIDYQYGFQPGSSGLYTIYNTQKPGSRKFQVNYRGQVFNDPVYQSGNNPTRPYYFGNDLQPLKKVEMSFQYNQVYFDRLYKNLGWDRYRKLYVK